MTKRHTEQALAVLAALERAAAHSEGEATALVLGDGSVVLEWELQQRCTRILQTGERQQYWRAGNGELHWSGLHWSEQPMPAPDAEKGGESHGGE